MSGPITFPPARLGEAAAVAEKLRAAFAGLEWRAGGIARRLTASFGVAEASAADRSLFDAVARADANLYVAKQAGRNRVVAGEPAGAGQQRHPLSASRDPRRRERCRNPWRTGRRMHMQAR